MCSLHRLVGVVLTGFVISHTGLSGQLLGNLDWPVMPGGTGTRIVADFAQGLNQVSGEEFYFGARAIFYHETGPAVWLGAGYVEDEAVGAVGFMGSSGSVSFDAGFGFARPFDTWVWNIPVGITVWIDALTSGSSTDLRPFVRAEGIVVGGEGGIDTDVGFSLMGGFEVRPAAGRPGFHVGLQWITIDGRRPVALGGGLSIGL